MRSVAPKHCAWRFSVFALAASIGVPAAGAVALAPSEVELLTAEEPGFCSFTPGERPAELYAWASDEAAEEALDRLMKHVGLKRNFTIRASNVMNAAADIDEKGTRLILYNTAFMKMVGQTSANNWSSLSILAHEVGHHLEGHTLRPPKTATPEDVKRRKEQELDADEFSGFLLRRMGATLKEAQAAVNQVAKEEKSDTHPPKSARLVAVERGWLRADKLVPPVREPTTTPPVLNPPPDTSGPEESQPVPPPPAPPEIELFEADPSVIIPGEAAGLRWRVRGEVESCWLSGEGSVGVRGRKNVRPRRTRDYELSCTGPGGDDARSVSVEVEETEELARFCCDAFGTRRCRIEVNPVPPGEGCFCAGQGVGIACN